MRPASRHLLPFLTFLVPLGTLAWVGAAELRRGSEREEVALEHHAVTFLRAAENALEGHVDRYVAGALAPETLGLGERGLLQAMRALHEDLLGPEVLGLFLLDGAGDLVFPRPPGDELGLPLHAPPRHPGVLRAELHLERGEHGRALENLERVLAAPPAHRRDLEARVRAAFLRGGILRRRGEAAAADAYRATLDALDRLASGPGVGAEEPAALRLLCRVALAELGGRADERVELMRGISEGLYDHLADDLLAAVLTRLLEGIPAESPEHAAAIEAMTTNRFRVGGRRFAADYAVLLRETVRRRLRSEPEGPLFLVFASGDRTSLLAIRRTREEETTVVPCAWVGLHLDLGLLLHGVIDPFMTGEDAGFRLAVSDPDGLPVLPADPAESPAELELPTRTTHHGLVLRAVPADPESFLAARASARRNRWLLFAALFLLGTCGALLLWRSVAREAELARLEVDFVSRVSHELKTPISLVRLYGETLARGRATGEEQVRDFGRIVAREAERLDTMIGRILDFSRQEAGTLDYRPEPVDAAEHLDHLAELWRPRFEAERAHLEVTTAPGLRLTVDPAGLDNALANLLENALKYTPADARPRTVEVVASPANGHARIAVRDRGRGIAPDELDKVFDSFYRAGNAGEARGAGLGLALVRHFAEAHGGRVQARARPGGGTEFELELPLRGS